LWLGALLAAASLPEVRQTLRIAQAPPERLRQVGAGRADPVQLHVGRAPSRIADARQVPDQCEPYGSRSGSVCHEVGDRLIPRGRELGGHLEVGLAHDIPPCVLSGEGQPPWLALRVTPAIAGGG